MAEDFYSEGGYLANHPNWHTEDAGWKAGNIYRMITRNSLKPQSVAEVGCGAGEILKQLQQQMTPGVSFSGFEISPQAFEMSKSRENEKLHFYLKGLDEIKEVYDLVLLIDVFEHVDDFYGFLRNLKGKGKSVIFHIPLDLSVQSVYRAYPLLRKRANSGHIHYFTKDTALASLKDTGFVVKDHFYTGSYIDLPSRSVKSSLMKLPRKLLFAMNQDFAVRVLGGYSLMVLAE